jgi:glyoxylase-like metal-dependent hydrolase (beta-lactamase superfamily II)
MNDVAPGILRIASELGPRPFSQFLLLGNERSLLVDTGIVTTPAEVILPFFAEVGLDPDRLDCVLISHADADHFGGNAAVRAAAPRAVFCAHVADAGWIGDRARILRERYGWYAEHGAGADYDSGTKQWLAGAMGDDTPVDLGLVGGERFRLGSSLTVEVLHLPGHSAGHLGLWDPASRTAIVLDAVLGAGLLDHQGAVIHPPPYLEAAAYEATIARLQQLRPELLLTAHYAPMRGPEAAAFLDRSAAFVVAARAAVADQLRASGEATMTELLGELAPRLGPFTSFANELAGPIRAHLGELVAAGRAETIPGATPPTWRWSG